MLHVCQCFQVLLGVNRSTGSKVGKHQNGDAKHKHGGQFHFAAEVTTVSEKIQKLKFSQVLSLIGYFRLSWVSLIVRVCKSQVQARLQHEIQISGVGSYHFVTL